MAGASSTPPAKAEAAVHADPRTACFYARRALELAVAWAYKHDAALQLPYQDNLSALIHEPTLQAGRGRGGVQQGAGDQHARQPRRAQPPRDPDGRRAGGGARAVPRGVLARAAPTAARRGRRRAWPSIANALPKAAAAPKQTAEQLQQLEAGLRERDEKLAALLADKTALDEELKRLRAEVAAGEARPPPRSPTRTTTPRPRPATTSSTCCSRKPAGRSTSRAIASSKSPACPTTRARASSTTCSGATTASRSGWSRPSAPGAMRAWASSRPSSTPTAWSAQFGQRPLIFYSNGYEHWIWDDANYPPRAVQGFYKKDELELLIQRRSSRKPLASAEINPAIVERYYQTRGIRRIAEAFEQDHDRKALLVMATGAGKTRTVIALADLLMRCNWAKRVLFLADRVALVNQAVNAFKRHLPDASPVNLVTEKDAEGRVFVSTYPTMMGLIDETRDGQRRFGVGHFDLVIIDEAHRSVFQKYRAIFDYFDSLAGRADGDAQGRGRPQHLRPVRSGGRRADRRLLARRGGARRLPRAAAGGLGAAQVPARGHQVRRAVGGGQGPVGRAGVGRGWRRARPRRGRGGQQVAVQQGHRRQGAGAPDDARPQGRGRRPAGQDDPLRQEPGPCRVHRRALQRQLPALQGRVRARHHLQDGVRAEPDRRLLEQGQGAAHRASRWTCSTPASTCRRS